MIASFTRPARGALLAALTLLGTSSCQQDVPFPTAAEADSLRSLTGLNPEGDTTNALNQSADAVALGRRVFFDPAFSGCGTVSCSSCHAPETGYATHEALPAGCNGHHAARNAPTVLNVNQYQWFTWDGHKDSLWSHAGGPVLNPNEMGGSVANLRQRLHDGYATEYAALFGGADPLTQPDDYEVLANFGKVLEAYESTRLANSAPFDANVQDLLARASAKDDVTHHPAYLGLKTFVREGQCIQCHTGAGLTDNQFHNIGVDDSSPDPDEGRGREAGLIAFKNDPLTGLSEYSDDRRGPPNTYGNRNDKLNAIAAQTADPEMLGAFRTASLRNVGLTAPYFHNGSRASLEDVVDFYNQGGADGGFQGHKTTAGTITQLNLTAAQKGALVDLLKSLTGTPPEP